MSDETPTAKWLRPIIIAALLGVPATAYGMVQHFEEVAQNTVAREKIDHMHVMQCKMCFYSFGAQTDNCGDTLCEDYRPVTDD